MGHWHHETNANFGYMKCQIIIHCSMFLKAFCFVGVLVIATCRYVLCLKCCFHHLLYIVALVAATANLLVGEGKKKLTLSRQFTT